MNVRLYTRETPGMREYENVRTCRVESGVYVIYGRTGTVIRVPMVDILEAKETLDGQDVEAEGETSRRTY